MRAASALVLASAAMTSPAVADVIMCHSQWHDAACYLSRTVEPAFAADIPSAVLAQTTQLYATRSGRPAAKVEWLFTIPAAQTSAAEAAIGNPTGAVHAVIGRFDADLHQIVCGTKGVYGSLDAAGQFVKAGGVVIYALSISHAELASATIDTCEAF